MNRDDVKIISDDLTSIQFAIEGVDETVSRYVCETCEGSGVIHDGRSCDDCDGNGDHLLAAIREIRNNQLSMTEALNRIASALELIAEVKP